MTRSPPRSEPVWQSGIAGLARAYARGELDPGSVTRSHLDRIARHDHRIGAFADLDSAGARAAAAASAARWAAGRPLSPLDGVPLAVKANIAVAGLPWTAGIGAHRERRATADASCVARLRAAGAIILGTTRMDEAALGARGDNPWFGRTVNPHRLNASTGGSSSGSAAAVAAGFCAAALGTDTFGSVRIPAAWCGVFGAKLARGSVNLEGIVPLAPGFDCLGLLARHGEDCRRLAECLDPAPRATPGPPSLAVTGFDIGLPALGAALAARLEALGIAFQAISLAPDPFETLMKPALLVAEAEGAEIHRVLLDDRTAALSPGIRAMFEWGRARSPEERSRAVDAIAQGRTRILEQLEGFELLLSPVTLTAAPLIGREDDRLAARFTLAASICGLPALAVPFGTSSENLPFAIQIVGRDWNRIFDLGARLADPPPMPDLDAADQATS